MSRVVTLQTLEAKELEKIANKIHEYVDTFSSTTKISADKANEILKDKNHKLHQDLLDLRGNKNLLANFLASLSENNVIAREIAAHALSAITNLGLDSILKDEALYNSSIEIENLQKTNDFLETKISQEAEEEYKKLQNALGIEFDLKKAKRNKDYIKNMYKERLNKI